MYESIVAVWTSFDGIIAALDKEARNQKMPRQGLKLRICQMFRIHPGLNVHEKCYV